MIDRPGDLPGVGAPTNTALSRGSKSKHSVRLHALPLNQAPSAHPSFNLKDLGALDQSRPNRAPHLEDAAARISAIVKFRHNAISAPLAEFHRWPV